MPNTFIVELLYIIYYIPVCTQLILHQKLNVIKFLRKLEIINGLI